MNLNHSADENEINLGAYETTPMSYKQLVKRSSACDMKLAQTVKSSTVDFSLGPKAKLSISSRRSNSRLDPNIKLVMDSTF